MDFYYLYHICREKDKYNYSKGYIGISKKPSKRWASGYGKSQPHIRSALKKYDDIIKYVICFGKEKRIKFLEKKLRPTENIGWNIAIGGGNPPSPLKRLNNIKNLPKGKRRTNYKPTEEAKKKMSIAQKKRSGELSNRMKLNNPMKGKTGSESPNFKGVYHTPKGKFYSAISASKENGVSKSIVVKRCTKGSKILKVRKSSKDMVGKSWEEFG